MELPAGTFVCPLCPVLLAGCGLLIVSEDAAAWFWRGLCCSTEVQDGEEAEEEEAEEGRGSLGGEAGTPVELTFSIMVVKSLGETLSVPSSLNTQPPGVCVSVSRPRCVCV